MPDSPTLIGQSLGLSIVVFVAAGFTPPAQAQEAADEVITEIITTGTRRAQRTAAESMVPIDVITGEELENQGAPDMDDMLRTTIPSYNVVRSATSDEASIVRPATLRRLPADNTLLLINGKRRHRSGVIVSGGSQGPDLASIPAMAIRQMEVLRDGASAQYGSDAIAGVINFTLRDDAEGMSVEARTGEFLKGDGTLVQLAANAGFPLGENGFANVTAQWREMDPTNTAIQRTVAATLRRSGNAEQQATIGHPTAQPWSQQEVRDDVMVFLNSGIELSDSQEIYFFGNVGSRDTETNFLWRNPNSQGSVYTSNFNGTTYRAVVDTNIIPGVGGQVSNCPALVSPGSGADGMDLDPAAVAADEAALNSLPANCFVLNQLVPGGYTPFFGAEVSDASGVMGIRGELNNDLTYDFSGSIGRNEAEFYIRDTWNPSLGPDGIVDGELQRDFDIGSYTQVETNLNADFTYPIDVEAFASDLNFAFGAEWRKEEFETRIGEENSWKAGDYALQNVVSSNPNCYGDGVTCQVDSSGAPIPLPNLAISTHGFAGFSPPQAGRWDRSNWAVYADLEADITERFAAGVAVRFEDFDTFGTTTNGKLSGRLAITDSVAVRATYSTGFRAPTPGQANQTKLRTNTVDGELVQAGQIPPTNPIAVFLGGRELEPEEATNFTIGAAIDLTDSLSLTVDYFNIEFENRLGSSGNINIAAEPALTDGSCPIAAGNGDSLAACLEENGVPGATNISALSFPINDTDGKTTTQGIDVVATWSLEFDNIGSGELIAAWNWTELEVDKTGPTATRNVVVANEKGRPDHRGIFTYNHYVGDFRFLLRASYYGSWVNAGFNGDPTWSGPGDNPQYTLDCAGTPNSIGGIVHTDECYGSEWIFDVEAAYSFSDRWTVIAGIQNFTDNFGPEDKINARGVNVIGTRYDPAGPFNYDGGFAYFRLRADF